MNQRRTPGGQRPARRPGQPGRAGIRAVRAGVREPGVRLEARGLPTRTPGPSRGIDGTRPVNRPAAARRTASTGAVKRTTAQQPRRFTGRATVLFAVLIALALAYTYPIRVYLNQQSDIARMEAAQAEQRRRIGELSEQAALWKDPEYIKIQAKKRFYMVYPGEVPLVVLSDPEGAARDAGTPAGTTPAQAPTPWYDTLWSSVRAANQPAPADR